jgi:hypothetical protein
MKSHLPHQTDPMPVFERIDQRTTALALSRHLNPTRPFYPEKALAACLEDMTLDRANP